MEEDLKNARIVETVNSWLYEPEGDGIAADSLPVALDSAAVSKWRKRRRAMDDFISRRRSLILFIPPARVKELTYGFVNLIKTIEDYKFPYIVEHIIGYFKGKYTRDKIVAYIRSCGVSEARAELITDDQINKLAERLKIERWKAQGISKAKWLHSGMGEYRPYHMRKWNGRSGKRDGNPNGLNGFVFDIDSPPVIDTKTGERGYPGQLIGCRCRLEPVLI